MHACGLKQYSYRRIIGGKALDYLPRVFLVPSVDLVDLLGHVIFQDKVL